MKLTWKKDGDQHTAKGELGLWKVSTWVVGGTNRYYVSLWHLKNRAGLIKEFQSQAVLKFAKAIAEDRERRGAIDIPDYEELGKRADGTHVVRCGSLVFDI